MRASIGDRSSRQSLGPYARFCRLAAGRSGQSSPNGLSNKERIALFLRSAIVPALAALRWAARATARRLASQHLIGPSLRSAIVPALAALRRAARATAPRLASQHLMGPSLRSAIVPALAALRRDEQRRAAYQKELDGIESALAQVEDPSAAEEDGADE